MTMTAPVPACSAAWTGTITTCSMPIWTVGFFEFINNEHRYSQYLNRVGNDTITAATTGSFAGLAGNRFRPLCADRQLTYVDAGFGVDFGARPACSM